MAGRGIAAQRSHRFRKFFEEHGFIIGIMSIMPRSTYDQGIEKMWNRPNRYSYYWPVFSHLESRRFIIEKFMLKVLLLMMVFLVISHAMKNIEKLIRLVMDNLGPISL